MKREIGVTIPPNYPLVGIDFNATGAGIHIDGVIKNEEIYNIFDTEKILNRPLTVVITDKSGLAGDCPLGEHPSDARPASSGSTNATPESPKYTNG